MPKAKRKKPTLRQIKAGVEFVDDKAEALGEQIQRLEELVLGLVDVMRKQSADLRHVSEELRKHLNHPPRSAL
jgi:hypothetical protein